LSQDRQAPCEAPELVGVRPYDLLVCQGLANFDRARFGEAARDFERALAMNIEDAPNFRLMPRLAMTYWEEGDSSSARTMLAKARVAVSLMTGILVCAPENDPREVLDNWGAEATLPQAREIGRRMCGSGFETWYHRSSVESFVKDAEVARIFLEAEKRIH
jgi:hypothetical protein